MKQAKIIFIAGIMIAATVVPVGGLLMAQQCPAGTVRSCDGCYPAGVVCCSGGGACPSGYICCMAPGIKGCCPAEKPWACVGADNTKHCYASEEELQANCRGGIVIHCQ